MRLLLDQGVPRTTVKHLADQGLLADHVGELGMATATDTQVLAAAVQRDAVVVSLDSDFHSLLAASGAASPSVIRIRIEGLKGDQLAAVLLRVLASVGAELHQGAAVSVSPSRIRVRLLPL